jgi:hypothetical protein
MKVEEFTKYIEEQCALRGLVGHISGPRFEEGEGYYFGVTIDGVFNFSAGNILEVVVDDVYNMVRKKYGFGDVGRVKFIECFNSLARRGNFIERFFEGRQSCEVELLKRLLVDCEFLCDCGWDLKGDRPLSLTYKWAARDTVQWIYENWKSDVDIAYVTMKKLNPMCKHILFNCHSVPESAFKKLKRDYNGVDDDRYCSGKYNGRNRILTLDPKIDLSGLTHITGNWYLTKKLYQCGFFKCPIKVRLEKREVFKPLTDDNPYICIAEVDNCYDFELWKEGGHIRDQLRPGEYSMRSEDTFSLFSYFQFGPRIESKLIIEQDGLNFYFYELGRPHLVHLMEDDTFRVCYLDRFTGHLGREFCEFFKKGGDEGESLEYLEGLV